MYLGTWYLHNENKSPPTKSFRQKVQFTYTTCSVSVTLAFTHDT